jgi:hypothetical protein
MAAIEKALFPNGAQTPNDRKDIEIVFNAAKYGATLVTGDGSSRSQPGGILGGREALRRLGIRVLTDSEAVGVVREKIVERDGLARLVAADEGVPLPGWVDKD